MSGWTITRTHYAAPWALPWASGRYYTTPLQGATSTSTFGATAIQFTPLYVPNIRGVTITRIGIEVVTAAAAGKIGRLGIYNDQDSYPTGLLLDAGTIALDPGAVPVMQEITISQYLRQGWYWLALCGDGTTGTYRTTALGSMFDMQPVKHEYDTASNHGYNVVMVAGTVSYYLAAGLPLTAPFDAGIVSAATRVPRTMVKV